MAAVMDGCDGLRDALGLDRAVRSSSSGTKDSVRGIREMRTLRDVRATRDERLADQGSESK